jgi:hypothetical protein
LAANLTKNLNKIDKIKINGVATDDPTKMANAFNEFFSSIGTDISNSIPTTNTDPLSYMENDENVTLLDLGTTSQIHICDVIKSMLSKNSLDLDGISTNLIKSIAIEISVPLAHIFNLSLNLGVFPNKLKTSRIVPIFKAGDPESCDNYRPISLLSSLSKILEKMVSIQLVNHLDRNNLLYVNQFGFQKGKSTEHNLIKAVNYIGELINSGKFCIGVFFDLKKAFDVVSHDILLKKLAKLGIQGVALKWFESYLQNRRQVVDINGNTSTASNIKISVLLGSILGPILFLCFINDLFKSTDLLTVMFADDTCCLDSDDNLESLICRVNAEINKIAV